MRRYVLLLFLWFAQSALAQDTSAEAMFQEAQQAQQKGDYTTAAQKYQQLTAAHPELVSAHANLGVVLVQLARVKTRNAILVETPTLSFFGGK
jgi:thioredoxin-like negative regulator of GroEL